MTSIPPWLAVMKTLTGTKEVAGAEANPVITGMTTQIARRWPEMKWYCDLPSWDSDETAWCGVAAAYCMAEAGIRPPFQDEPAPDTDRFGWALAWADDLNYTPIATPVPGCVVVLERSGGGGHVTFYESTSGSTYMCRGGNQSNSVNLSGYDKSTVVALMWPLDVPLPPAPRRTLQLGDTGSDVIMLQQSLGLIGDNADGDFGSITETQVKGFQRACSLAADGVVGDATWEQIDDLNLRKSSGDERISPEMEAAVIAIANSSGLADYSWPGRGQPPPGYIAGVCCSFAVAVAALEAGDSAAMVMAQRQGDPAKDALAYYKDEFAAAGMANDVSGVHTLRHLFVMLMGLGMRESSGNHWEGRDMSASNTDSMTCEAGLFQSSYNFSSASPEIGKLFEIYWENPNGFLATYDEDLAPTSSQLDVYGSGDGARYQWLARFCPDFACASTAVGMRVIRAHWGPIGRKEVTISELADDVLYQVQEMVEQTPEPLPPVPLPDEPSVDIVTTGDVVVTINGKVVG